MFEWNYQQITYKLSHYTDPPKVCAPPDAISVNKSKHPFHVNKLGIISSIMYGIKSKEASI